MVSATSASPPSRPYSSPKSRGMTGSKGARGGTCTCGESEELFGKGLFRFGGLIDLEKARHWFMSSGGGLWISRGSNGTRDVKLAVQHMRDRLCLSLKTDLTTLL
eukprot:2503571-Rhodomonas_salina.2